ncbi:MAG: ATP-binding protein [Acidobacteriota bacterium]
MRPTPLATVRRAVALPLHGRRRSDGAGTAGTETPIAGALLQRQLRLLIAIRLLVVASMAIPYLLLFDGSRLGEPITGPPAPAVEPTGAIVQLLIGLVCAQTLLYIALHQMLRTRAVAQAYVQFAGDLLLITTAVYRFGNGENSLSILYFVVIIVAAVLLRRHAAVIVAGLAFVTWLAPALLVDIEWTWALQTMQPLLGTLTNVPGIQGVDALLHLSGFYAVALLTSSLAHSVTMVERKLEERHQDLQDLQSIHRDVIQSIASGLVTTDLGGQVTSLNHAAEEILGVNQSDLLGHPIVDSGLFSLDSWQAYCQQLQEVDGDVTVEEAASRVRHETETQRNGQTVYIGFSLTQLRDNEGTQRGYILAFQNLTAWRALQEQLRLRDRMAALGTMAAGLAHEVGNPLAAISGSVQLLASSIDGDAPQRKLLDITLKESQRLDRTVKNFLQFARPRARRSVTFDIGKMLDEEIALLRSSHEVRPDHTLTTRFEPPDAQISADPDQIGQLFWNLARNALKAMPDGGTLEVAGARHNDRYALSFRDTGVGMTEEERAMLFQPFKSFFDRGMGIGMAIVYRIVEEHGGAIRVESAPSRGTTITIDLPHDPPQRDPIDPGDAERDVLLDATGNFPTPPPAAPGLSPVLPSSPPVETEPT